MNLKRFIYENIRFILFNLGVLFFINIYFLVLSLLNDNFEELLYLDIMLIFIYICAFIIKYIIWKDRFKEIYEIMRKNNDINISDINKEFLEEEIMRYIINKKDENYLKELNIRETQIKDLEEYIAKWTHEIKLPISTIYMILERMENEYVSLDIKNEIEKINFLVNSVMYGSRATAASEDIFISEVNVQDLIKQAIKNNAFMLIRNNIEIKLENNNFKVFTDKKWILYVLNQIINNAIKYSKENGVIEINGRKENNNYILTFKDYGIGITQEDILKLFERFHRGANAKKEYPGTGLGLSIVSRIIKAHKGNIEIQSELNKYTIVTVTIPLINDCNK